MNGSLSKILLNGNWTMQYLGVEQYSSNVKPDLSEGFLIEDAVPAYWEDMMDKFRENTIHRHLKYNPSYTLQRYPQVGYVPDMHLPNVMGCFAYKRNFTVLKSQLNIETELYLEGVQNMVSAWLNGKYLGVHEGFSSDYSFSIPANTLCEGENEIILVVSNLQLKGYGDRPVSGCINRAANEYTGGIYGDVEIRFYPDGVKGARIITAKDLSSFSILTLGNDNVKREVTIYDGDKILCQTEIKVGENKVDVSTEGFTLWSTDNPKLYTLSIKTKNQVLNKKFGIRSLAVAKDGIHLTLNGNPFFFRGICEHGYYAMTVHPPREKSYYVKALKTLKKLGFNAVRFHTWIPVKAYMQAADELGMLIEAETPNNTTYEEWKEIVRFTSDYTSVVMYSSGNEMVIDEDYIEHLRKCAELVHTKTDSLFSPMSAMRGIEYFSYGDNKVDEPFPHNPVRLEALKEFCDVFNSYTLGRTSYFSEMGTASLIEYRNSIYKKPLLSHEICIQGTYCDLSLKDRYRGTRIGDTELYSSVERHLMDKGLLDRAPIYYKNSVEWQRRLRKQCFETVRRSNSFAGYDFLGDIDHHWHTFGYCVGMMNEFYELKPSETIENVLRYNSSVVILADLPYFLNYKTGSNVSVPISVSNYSGEGKNSRLTISVLADGKVFLRKDVEFENIEAGKISKLYDLEFTMPESDKPLSILVRAKLSSGEVDAENEWELYAFPETVACENIENHVVYGDELSYDELVDLMSKGKNVLLLGCGPFAKINTSFQMALAGRTEGHLATVVNDHPITRDFPHDGFCGWQFRNMINEGYSSALDLVEIPFKPIIEIASCYKYARREALMFEYKIGNGKLLVCSLGFAEKDVGAVWLKNRILSYFNSEEFNPQISITENQLYKICHGKPVFVIENANKAFNANDITM